MKKILFFMLSLFFSFSSCHKDKGNYDYSDLENIVATQSTERINLKLGGKDTLWTDFYHTGNDTRDTLLYSYNWKQLLNTDVVDLSIHTPYITITMLDSIGIRGSLDFYVEVVHKATGLLSYVIIKALLLNPLEEGWLLLCERQGRSDLNFLSTRNAGYELLNDFTDSLGLTPYLTGRPISSATLNLSNSFVNAQWGRSDIAVSTEDRVVILDGTNLSVRGEMTSFLTNGFKPSAQNPVNLVGSHQGYAWQGGNVHFFWLSGEDPFYPFTGFTPHNDYKIVEQYRYRQGLLPEQPKAESFQTEPFIVPFDRLERILFFNSEKSQFGISPSPNGSGYLANPYNFLTFNLPFDPTGAVPICGAATSYTDYILLNALLKNKDGNFYFLSFVDNGILKKVEKVDEPRLAGAKHVVIDMLTGYIIFDQGAKVFAYDVNRKSTRELLDFGTGEVSVLKFERIFEGRPTDVETDGRAEVYKKLARNLIVCTFDPSLPDTGGVFRLYDIPLGHQSLIEAAKVTGLPRIQDALFNRLR